MKGAPRAPFSFKRHRNRSAPLSESAPRVTPPIIGTSEATASYDEKTHRLDLLVTIQNYGGQPATAKLEYLLRVGEKTYDPKLQLPDKFTIAPQQRPSLRLPIRLDQSNESSVLNGNVPVQVAITVPYRADDGFSKTYHYKGRFDPTSPNLSTLQAD